MLAAGHRHPWPVNGGRALLLTALGAASPRPGFGREFHSRS